MSDQPPSPQSPPVFLIPYRLPPCQISYEVIGNPRIGSLLVQKNMSVSYLEEKAAIPFIGEVDKSEEADLVSFAGLATILMQRLNRGYECTVEVTQSIDGDYALSLSGARVVVTAEQGWSVGKIQEDLISAVNSSDPVQRLGVFAVKGEGDRLRLVGYEKFTVGTIGNLAATEVTPIEMPWTAAHTECLSMPLIYDLASFFLSERNEWVEVEQSDSPKDRSIGLSTSASSTRPMAVISGSSNPASPATPGSGTKTTDKSRSA